MDAGTRTTLLALLNEVDLFMPNESELCHLTGTSNWQEGLKALPNRSTQIVVKRGATGAVAVTGGVVVEVPAVPVSAFNTIGAGDVFDVSFLYGRRKGWTTRQCLEFACAAAGFVVSQVGSRTYPDENTVLSLARSRPERSD